ncbi:hypothetical protein GGX14DRAFT_623038 [Mycena pura]|uniref:F-box domain-containing protein n=1 Tax=Mycena pura TaxID=153505 RepID=A0AAD6YI48_9AGAR|nr:hypothetical protein GGX14DRAFT_623038 [Mycena pura]
MSAQYIYSLPLDIRAKALVTTVGGGLKFDKCEVGDTMSGRRSATNRSAKLKDRSVDFEDRSANTEQRCMSAPRGQRAAPPIRNGADKIQMTAPVPLHTSRTRSGHVTCPLHVRSAAAPRRIGLLSWPNRKDVHLLDYLSWTVFQLRRLEADISKQQFRSLRPLQKPLPLLQCISAPLGSTDLQDILQCAPQLRELHIVQLASDFHLVSKSLVRLEISRHLLIDTFLSILNNCPRLSHLKCSVDASRARKPAPATFPNIESLGLMGGEHLMFRGALKSLTLPNLSHFEFGESLEADSEVLSFLMRSSCTIQHLELRFTLDDHEDDDDVQRLLQMYPSVETLEIYGGNLSWLEPKRGLLPHLQSATIHDGWIDFDQVIGLVHRRRDSTHTADLRTLVLIGTETTLGKDDLNHARWPPDPSTTSEFKRLMSHGLKLSIRVEFMSKKSVWPDGIIPGMTLLSLFCLRADRLVYR